VEKRKVNFMHKPMIKKQIELNSQTENLGATEKRVHTLAGGTNIQLPATNLPENEPSVAVNPINPLTIISVSHDYTVDGFALYQSFDGGNTFNYSILPVTTGFDILSDPIVDFGLNNISMVSGLAAKDATNEASIIVFRSVDGGLTYSNSTIVSDKVGNGIFDDKEYLAIDKSATSPFQGISYITYTRFTNNFNNTQILLQRSTDGGVTWSSPAVPITPVFTGLPFVQGSNVQTGPNGEMYVAWIEGNFVNANFRIRRSDDGGVTFGPTVTVNPIVLVPPSLNSNVPQWGFRTPTFAFLAVDTSGCFGSADFARVYAVWQAYNTNNAHILISFSDDGGVTWSTPSRVDDSAENTQNFFPFVSVSACSGTCSVIYYTNRVSPTLLDVFAAISTNGGASFTNMRITDVSFNPNADPSFGNPSAFIGDYIFSAFIPPNLPEPEKLVSVWTDTRTGSQDIFANINDLPRSPTSITCPANITVGNTPGQCGAVVNFPSPTVNANCPGAIIECSPPSGSTFPVGTTTVTCTATDPCGGGSVECSFSVTVEDREAPSITCPGNITVNNDPGQCGAIVNYPSPTVSDNCPDATATCSPEAGTFFPIGTTTVTCTATDTAGNTAKCTFTVTVVDTEPPVIQCSADITTLNDPGLNGAIVHFIPTVKDNGPGITAVCTPASGSFFPPGTTLVTCTATDSSGNTSTCSFNVRVITDPCRFFSNRCRRRRF
jgi:hypothetical protein